MSKKNITISDNEGVILHPLTVASQVVMESGGTLDTYLDDLETEVESSKTTVYYQANQPAIADSKEGDIWIKSS